MDNLDLESQVMPKKNGIVKIILIILGIWILVSIPLRINGIGLSFFYTLENTSQNYNIGDSVIIRTRIINYSLFPYIIRDSCPYETVNFRTEETNENLGYSCELSNRRAFILPFIPYTFTRQAELATDKNNTNTFFKPDDMPSGSLLLVKKGANTLTAERRSGFERFFWNKEVVGIINVN